jgi:hypothetical protein
MIMGAGDALVSAWLLDEHALKSRLDTYTTINSQYLKTVFIETHLHG